MAINSISPFSTQPISTGITSRVNERPPVAEENPQIKERRDTLELSSQVQQQQQVQQGRDTNRTDQLQQVQSQISSGYYNQPEVLRETAVRVARDLQNSFSLSSAG